MKGKKRLLLISASVAIIVAVSVGILISRGDDTPPVGNTKLPQETIDQTVSLVQNLTAWAVGLADIHVDYRAGIEVEGAIVLHNGNDAERVVTLEYRASSTPEVDKETGKVYEPSPPDTENWVSIEASNIRMAPMQTEVVKVFLEAPRDAIIPYDRWEFRVLATGIVIGEDTMDLLVTTTIGDHELVLPLNQPLLMDDLSSILSVSSNITENLQVVSYNATDRRLIIEGLQDNTIRSITLIYEYGEFVRTAYEQKWFITMV